LEILLFAAVAVVVIAVIIGLMQGAKINELQSKLQKEFPSGKVHVSHNDSSFLVVDFLSGQVVIGLAKARGTLLSQEMPYRSEIPFSGVIKVEILKDGTQVASTNRGSQALGAAVGGIAFGGVGAIIGGLSGSSTSTTGTKRLSIQITVDSENKPIHEVTFYETERKKGGKRGEIFFDQGAKQISEFAAYLESAIRKADAAMNVKSYERAEGKAKLPTEQLTELWQLRQAGALTQEEFEDAKAKLINS